jgi:hypothetical protein
VELGGKWYLNPDGSPVAYGLQLAPAGLILWDGTPWHERYEIAAGHLILRDQVGKDRIVFPIVKGDALTGKIERYGDTPGEDDISRARLLRDPGDLTLG